MAMFCNQCEQTARSAAGDGCLIKGLCGKSADVSAMQDVIIFLLQGVSQLSVLARKLGAIDKAVDAFIPGAMLATLTNVNFDEESLYRIANAAIEKRDHMRTLYLSACRDAGVAPASLTGAAVWHAPKDMDGMVSYGQQLAMSTLHGSGNEDVDSLRLLIRYAIKGLSAYVSQAQKLGKEDDAIYDALESALVYLNDNPTDINEMLEFAFKLGEVNIKALELLDAGHTETFGHPEPTEVRVTPIKGKAIVVSGHELADLEKLLQQTAGKGINVYTNGELLSANAYPKLKKYPHLIGNYGGAWYKQQKEFDQFPGAILVTSNCFLQPRFAYKDRIFTTGVAGWPGVKHLADKDFTPVIEAALTAPGFTEEEPKQTITIGFARNALMNAVDKMINAIKNGTIRHLFFMGGCDGAKMGRSYFTDFADAVPNDCIILTLACGKYRFNKHAFGNINGIPRLLDIGQCNDSYSAIQIVLALANAFECDVNDLPLSFVFSWFEQKAVVILFSLLHLGIKNIHMGPSLPAFISPNVLHLLVEKYDLHPITSVQQDMGSMLAEA